MRVLIFLALVVAAANAWTAVPVGTTITTTSTTVTTTTSSDDGDGSPLLPAAERSLIRSTWAMAKKNGKIPPKFFLRFLTSYPEYQRKFAKFADVPQSELAQNGNFLAQAYTIAAGLSIVVESLGSQEMLNRQLTHLGTSHYDRGVDIEGFERIGPIIVSVLEEELGSSMSPAAKQAWEDGVRALISAVSNTLKSKDEVPCPVTGLSRKQIADVRRSWESVKYNRVAIVASVFAKLFGDNPSVQRKFVKFGDVPLAALPSDSEFMKQATKVANRIDSMISSLNNDLQILGQTKYMGHSHAPRGVAKSMFEDFSTELINVLSKKGIASSDLVSWKGALQALVNRIAEDLH